MLIVWSALTSTVAAQDCPAPQTANLQVQQASLSNSTTSAEKKRTIRLEADKISVTDDGNVEVSGNVIARGENLKVSSEKLKYLNEGQLVVLDTPSQFEGNDIVIQSQSGKVALASQQAEFSEADFQVQSQNSRGSAEKISLNGEVVDLNEVRYSTCPPSKKSWQLEASEIELDNESGLGTAKHARIRAGSVPIFYFPFFYFPIDDRRKTGFLAPSVGDSANSGFEIAAPYYLNLASHRDLLFTPRLLSKRGAQIQSKFRYLNRNDRGTIEAHWLPNDQLAKQDRNFFSWQHEGRYFDWLSAQLLYSDVNSRNYFDNLGDTLSSSSSSLLERRLSLTAAPTAWMTLRAETQSFRITDENLADSDRPFERVPSIQLGLGQNLNTPGLRARIDSEWTRFSRSGGSTPATDRSHIAPTLQWLDRKNWGHLKAKASWQYSQYRSNSSTQSRTLPSFEIDSGLKFSRLTDIGRVQTLEPRLAYYYTPFRDQSTLPNFDAASPDLSYEQFFRSNRFSGVDRISDANHISFGFRSQLYTPNDHRNLLTAEIAQLVRLDKEQVGLTTNQQATGSSDTFASVNWNFSRFVSSKLLAQWDHSQDRFNRAQALLQWRSSAENSSWGTRVLAAYRFRRDLLEQTDLIATQSLGNNWSAIGRWGYSLRDNSSRNALFGMKYRSCCWAVQVGWRRYLNGGVNRFNNAIYLQFELTGLAKLGDDLESLLGRDILSPLTD